jgi:hypothetical protein
MWRRYDRYEQRQWNDSYGSSWEKGDIAFRPRDLRYDDDAVSVL